MKKEIRAMMPFKLQQTTSIEKWRAETFYIKEPETIAWIQSFSTFDSFIDIGANIGVYSLYAAHLFPLMPIYSLEPSRYNYESLVINIKLNSFSNVHAYPMGAGDKLIQSRFLDADCMPGASGGKVSSQGYLVSVTTIAHIIDGHTPAYYNVKIDIDGGELSVIKGIGNKWGLIKSVLVEINSDRDEIIDLFLDQGFTTANRFNTMTPHSRERRQLEGIPEENVVFTR